MYNLATSNLRTMSCDTHMEPAVANVVHRRNVQSALDGSTQRALDQAAAALELMVRRDGKHKPQYR